MKSVFLVTLLLMALLIGDTVDEPQIVPQAMFVWKTEKVNKEVLEEMRSDGFNTLYMYI